MQRVTSAATRNFKWYTQEWRKITPEMCQKMIAALPGRLRAIIKKKGRRLTGRRTQPW